MPCQMTDCSSLNFSISEPLPSPSSSSSSSNSTIIHLQKFPSNSTLSSQLPVLVSFIHENDLKILKQYIIELENQALANNEENYLNFRRQLVEYLVSSPSTVSSLPESTNSQLRSYKIQYSKKTVADILFPQRSQQIYSFLTSKKWVTFLISKGSITFIPLLLVLFGVVPKELVYLYFFAIIIGTATGFLTLKVQLVSLLLKCWDFWYFAIQGIVFGVEFCFLFPDHRMVIGLCFTISIFLSCLLDAVASNIRKNSLPYWISCVTYFSILLAGIHYNFFPNIHDYRFQFYTIQWEIRQMIESTLFIIILWSGRWAFFCYKFPNDAIILKLMFV